MAYNGPTPPPRKKNIVDDFKLRLSAPPQGGAQKPASLQVSVVKGQVNFDVWTNVPNDKDNGRIRGQMGPIDFFAVLEVLQLIIDSTGPKALKVPNTQYTFYQGKRSAEPQVVSNTEVARGEDGRIYIALLASNRPPIQFFFGPTQGSTVTNRDGSPLEQGALSTIYAKSWARMLSKLVPRVLSDDYEQPAPYTPPGQQGGQRPQQQQQGGYQQSPQSGGEDIFQGVF